MTALKRSVFAGLLLVALTACGGGDDETGDSPPSSEPTPTMSEVDAALAKSACQNYPDVVKDSRAEVRRLESGKTDFITIMTSVWGGARDDISSLSPPVDSELESAFADVSASLKSLYAAAESWNGGVFDVDVEMQAFRAADDAVTELCKGL
jgi:hypothetical protein